MKDGSKTISQRATRFLPVDMKDRLKSAFNRNNPAGTPAEGGPSDEADFAVFMPNRPAQSNLNPMPTPIGPMQQVASDIEEAEIVAESAPEPIDGARLEVELHSNVAGGSPAERKTASLKNVTSRLDADARADISKKGESGSKTRSRFFAASAPTEFASSESVRLKVDKRNDKRADLVSVADGDEVAQPPDLTIATGSVNAEQRGPHRLESESATSDLAIDENGTPDAITVEAADSEPAHINESEEYDSMEASEHESRNGAASEGNADVVFSIDRNSKFSGQLKFAGAISIEGQVEGELSATRIVVHQGGIVNASINGKTVVIAGSVKGDVNASDELEILATGVVDGSVTAPAITVERGARLEGLIAIGSPRG